MPPFVAHACRKRGENLERIGKVIIFAASKLYRTNCKMSTDNHKIQIFNGQKVRTAWNADED